MCDNFRTLHLKSLVCEFIQRHRSQPDAFLWSRFLPRRLLAGMHCEFGRILPTRDFDGMGPYLDPLEPIPRKHIERAAARASIRPSDIEAQVASLSAYLGWDVTVGAKKKAVKRAGPSKPGRKQRH